MPEFTPTDKRFLPPDGAADHNVPDLEAYLRGVVDGVFTPARYSTMEDDERVELVAQAMLIAEELQRAFVPGKGFIVERRDEDGKVLGHNTFTDYRRALAANLGYDLVDYWREQHPEYRRNTRAERAAAARGEEYIPKVWQATGLAHEHGDKWSASDPVPRTLSAEDAVIAEEEQREKEARRVLMLAQLANASTPEFFQDNPHLFQELRGVASWGRVTRPQGKHALEYLRVLREEDEFMVKLNPGKII
jgi:hypothetical protein